MSTLVFIRLTYIRQILEYMKNASNITLKWMSVLTVFCVTS